MMNINKFGFVLSVLFLIMGIYNASAATVMLDFPPDISRGQMFDIKVIINPNGDHIAGVQLDLEFNKSSVFLNSITEGNFLKQSGINTYFNSGTINNTIGKAVNINGAILGRGNVTTSGAFIIINATSIGSTKAADINLTNILVVDPEGKHIYPLPTPKQSIQTETVSSASGDISGGGGTGGTSSESFQELAGSNKTLLAMAFVGIIVLIILVYKYVLPKYSAPKDEIHNIENKMPNIEKQNKIKTTRKKISSIIQVEASNGNVKNIAADTKINESGIKKVRAPRSKEREPTQTKNISRKKKVTVKRTGKTPS